MEQKILQVVTNEEQEELLKRASRKLGLSMSSFLRACGLEKAQDVLEVEVT